VIKVTPWPIYSWERELVPILQGGWVGLAVAVGGCGKSCPHWCSSPV